MTTPDFNTLELRFSRQILDAAADDPTFDVPALLRSTDEPVEKLAAALARMAFEGKLRFDVAGRIRLMVEQHFRPPAPEPFNPLVDSASRMHDQFDPWLRHAEINAPEHVVVIGGSAPLGIEDTRHRRDLDHVQAPIDDATTAGGEAA
jgi:hypothetical protein